MLRKSYLLVVLLLTTILATPTKASTFDYNTMITTTNKSAPSITGKVHSITRHQMVYGDARPRAWCGWYMRQKLGVRDKRFNLAKEWSKYGQPASPGPGVVVVWPHHVGIIVGQAAGGNWLVESGNDGHAVRTRARSLKGAIAFRA